MNLKPGKYTLYSFMTVLVLVVDSITYHISQVMSRVLFPNTVTSKTMPWLPDMAEPHAGVRFLALTRIGAETQRKLFPLRPRTERSCPMSGNVFSPSNTRSGCRRLL